MHGHFVTDKSFGTKFLYSIDRALQVFFVHVSSIEESDGNLEDVTNLLLSKAVSLMTTVEYRETLAIEVPAHLAQNARTTPASPSKKTKSPTATAASNNHPADKAATSTSFHHPSEEHVNPHTYPSWLVDAGTGYLNLFKDRAPSVRNWPKILDDRLPKKNNKTRAAPLCVRFQMTGKCVYGCSLAHILREKMTQGEFGQTDRMVGIGDASVSDLTFSRLSLRLGALCESNPCARRTYGNKGRKHRRNNYERTAFFRYIQKPESQMEHNISG